MIYLSYHAISIKVWIKNEVLFSRYLTFMNVLFKMLVFVKTSMLLVITLIKKV